jgi:integration host factor subunit beta
MVFWKKGTIFRKRYTEMTSMTRSDLIQQLSEKQSYLSHKQTEMGVRHILDQMALALEHGNRIEIRGFGSFSVRRRPPCITRNPKTGNPVAKKTRYIPYFKPGKALKERVNASVDQYPVIAEDVEETK